jgi:hypothetical protein
LGRDRFVDDVCWQLKARCERVRDVNRCGVSSQVADGLQQREDELALGGTIGRALTHV